jgi:hypothetical protein
LFVSSNSRSFDRRSVASTGPWGDQEKGQEGGRVMKETNIHCPDQPACPRVNDPDERELRLGELIIRQKLLPVRRGGASLPKDEMALNVLSESLTIPDISIEEV